MRVPSAEMGQGRNRVSWGKVHEMCNFKGVAVGEECEVNWHTYSGLLGSNRADTVHAGLDGHGGPGGLSSERCHCFTKEWARNEEAPRGIAWAKLN